MNGYALADSPAVWGSSGSTFHREGCTYAPRCGGHRGSFRDAATRLFLPCGRCIGHNRKTLEVWRGVVAEAFSVALLATQSGRSADAPLRCEDLRPKLAPHRRPVA